MHNKSLFSLFLLFCFLLSYVSILLSGASSYWSIQTVDKNHVKDNIFMELDSHGKPHLAYVDYVGLKIDNLMYASMNNSNWNIQTVKQGFFNILDFALDQNDNPNILYSWGITGEESGLWYASWTGSNWTFQAIDQSGSLWGSLAIDSNGNPHIAYVGDNNYLKYATWTGSKWSIQILEKTIGIDPVSLVLDSFGNPHIMYDTGIITSDQTSSLMKYGVWENVSNSWNYQTVLANNTIVQLVLDSNNFPHFTSINKQPYLTGTITYGSWNGSGWEEKTVNPNFPAETGGYFALDSNNNAHCVYSLLSSHFTANLVCSSWNGKAWETQIIDSRATAAGPIVFDYGDNLHVCYLGNVTASPVGINTAYLMYATATESAPTPTPTSDHTTAIVNSEFFYLISVVVPILVVVIVLIYIRKKKRLMLHFKSTNFLIVI